MSHSPALDALVGALQSLPGVGQKSASRMAYYLLQRDPQAALRLSQALTQAVHAVRHCSMCNTYCEDDICPTCADPHRDAHTLCVVQSPADQAALEQTGVYKGRYFVLLGQLSPMDGVGDMAQVLRRLAQRVLDPQANVRELIVATHFTAEGEATAHAISQVLGGQADLKITRLARGVPIGSELEYVDLSTIAHALVDRR